MMNPTLNNAARALAEFDIRVKRRWDTEADELERILPAAVEHCWPEYVPQAIAVLKAIREPDEAQIRAVDTACHEHWPNARKMAVAMQHALIDTITEGQD